MIIALLTGWLPGPGGIPLFIIGLSLLAINHDWAQRYTDKLKDYADRLGDLVFIKSRAVQIIYDIVAPLLVLVGMLVLTMHDDWRIAYFGIFGVIMGIAIFLGNRGRWGVLKKKLSRSKSG